jgi:hypothetical protein
MSRPRVRSLFTVGLCLAFVGAPVIVRGDDVGAATLRQLAIARAATVQYHDPAVALADGYVNLGAGEHGIEFVNFGLVDCHFDPAKPEALRYEESGDGLRLIGVEYAIPIACTATPPEGFAGDADVWEPEPGVPVWTLGAWIWVGNPGGVFGERESGRP